MKKIIALITVFTMLTALSSCSSDAENKENIETTAAVTEAVTTSAETTTATEAESMTEETETPEENTAISVDETKNDSLWAIDMSNKIAQWENNVNIQMSYEQDGISMEIGMHTLGNKFKMYTDLAGLFNTTIIFDGTNTYLIDPATSTYCVDSSGAYNGESETDAYLISEEAAESLTETGTEEINGETYIYEEYSIDGSLIRYYFTENAEIRYVGSEVDGNMVYMDFTVEFADISDETPFTVPDGYTEITEEEYAENLFAGMFPEE